MINLNQNIFQDKRALERKLSEMEEELKVGDAIFLVCILCVRNIDVINRIHCDLLNPASVRIPGISEDR